MTIAHAVLQTQDGGTTILEGVAAKGRVEGLLFELTVEQRYRNGGTSNIEAIYTFPLPRGAVLMSLEFEIGGRTLRGAVVKKERAERQYEDAIDAGDTAVLLERSGDGLYTVNVGNLMAGESAVVRYRYAQLLRFEKGSARLTIPTVIAPRYGNALTQAGLQPQQVPDEEFFAEYPFDMTVEIAQPLASGRIHSHSHAISTHRTDAATIVSLTRKGFLDRDFVLAFDELAGAAIPVVARDGTGAVALASFCPSLPQSGKREPRCVKILVDCSGSMAGSSIEAAKRALHEILASLEPRDKFSLARFGSTCKPDTKGLVAATPKAIAAAARVVFDMKADLGGTEMEAAMNETLEQSAGSRADVLLITDGQVWNVDGVVKQAASSGQRVFAVGIGAAPAESLLRRLADETGGACEFVLPKEDAEAAITRTFLRLSEKASGAVTVSWPAKPLWQLPLPHSVFDGETVHVLAGFSEPPAGIAELSVVPRDGGSTFRSQVVLSGCSAKEALPRMAASMRLGSMEGEAAAELAVKYQLVTEATSCVLVHVRAEWEKAEDLPEMVKVKQMVAAGWGGIDARGAISRMVDTSNHSYKVNALRYMSVEESSPDDAYSVGDIAFHRPGPAPVGTPREFVEALLAASNLPAIGLIKVPSTLAELESLGVDEDVVDALRAIIDEGYPEPDVVNAFLQGMIPIAELIGAPRLAIRKLRHLSSKRAEGEGPMTKVLSVLSGMAADRWR